MRYIAPFATNCTDLRAKGVFKAKWNETIKINEEADAILQEDNLILFEILDFNHKDLKS